MPPGDHLIDTLFDGRYLISRKLGSGGMANVYLAMDQELGRRVAIKILDDRHASDEQFVERFRREAQNAAGLSHPNIVSIYDRGDSEGTYYIAMEYIEGRTLKELLVARGPSPLGIAIDYTRQILSALRFAHRNGIVHRDIKPHNVIVDGEGRVKVMDFGIARAGAASQMTEAGSIIGTAQYLSPEQARGAPVDQTSDLYSTGIVLYELLTGSVPFTGETPVEIAMKHLSQAPVAAVHAPAGGAARPRLRRPARARQGSGRPLPLGRGDGLRSRPDRARDRRLRRDGRGGDVRPLPHRRRRGGDDDRPGRGREHDVHARALLRVRRAASPQVVLAVAARGAAHRRRARRRLVRLERSAGPAERVGAGGGARRGRPDGAARRTGDPRGGAGGAPPAGGRTPTSRPGPSSSRTRSPATGSSAATSSPSSSRPGRRRCRCRTWSAGAATRRSPRSRAPG